MGKQIPDLPVVFVRGDFEKALRQFKYRLKVARIFQILRYREKNPKPSQRKKARRRRNARRRMKLLRKEIRNGL